MTTPQTPQPYYVQPDPMAPGYSPAGYTPPPRKRPRWQWFLGGFVGLAILGGLIDAANGETTPVVVTVTAEPPAAPAPTLAEPTAASPTPPPVVDVVLPQVKGRNGKIVLDELEALGLTNVSTASADPNATVVLVASNWTATKIEPGPGTTVRSDRTVVVTMTKQ